MELDRIMNDMELSESDKSYIKECEDRSNTIESKVKSIWTVVEDSSGYG